MILTTGAVQALDPGQLDAVLAHERAHLAGRHPLLLATALVLLATAASPAPALAAGATDSVQRIHRLLGPAKPLGRARRQLLRATAAALALTPVLLALTPAVVALALGKLPAA